MEQSPHRPRVSRETRLLLSTALLAILALWILAHIRFPDQPAASTPVQPLLTQLGGRASFDDLASELAQLRPRIEPLFAGPALRIGEDAALTLLADVPPAGASTPPAEALGVDPASRLAIVRAPYLPAPPPVAWRPADPAQPRYLFATDPAAGVLGLRPILVGSLVPTRSPLWRDPIWLVPRGTDLAPGAFVFTADALLVGLAIDAIGRTAIVPGAVLLQEANRLLVASADEPGIFGIDVQALTPALAGATGAARGVVVAHVDPKGPAAATLAVGDVIEAIDDEPVETPQHWEAYAARATVGSSVMLRVRRDGEVRELGLIAAPSAPAPAGATLGLTLRSVAGAGAAVVEVEPGSVADRAGLRPGDVITLVGGTSAPAPAAVRQAFERAPPGSAVLLAYLRDRAPAVTVLEKP